MKVLIKVIIWTIFPSLMPKVWKTDGEDFVTYKWDNCLMLFVGSNQIRLSLKYVIKNLKVKK